MKDVPSSLSFWVISNFLPALQNLHAIYTGYNPALHFLKNADRIAIGHFFNLDCLKGAIRDDSLQDRVSAICFWRNKDGLLIIPCPWDMLSPRGMHTVRFGVLSRSA